MGTKMFGIAASVVMVVVAGCGTPPNAEVETATLALNAATEADAATYAVQPFAEAQAADQALRTELREQENSWLKSYDHARELAATLQSASERAEQAARLGKETVHDQATMTIDEAKMTLAQVRERLAKAPRRRATATVVEGVRAELATVESVLAQADHALEAGLFFEAAHHADTAKSTLTKITASLDQALGASR